MYCATWLIQPLLGRDCVSTARRERTSRLCQETPGQGSQLAGSCHFRANELCSFPQIFRHKSWTHIRSFGEPANLTLPTANENSSANTAGSDQQIGNSVPDHVP